MRAYIYANPNLTTVFILNNSGLGAIALYIDSSNKCLDITSLDTYSEETLIKYGNDPYVLSAADIIMLLAEAPGVLAGNQADEIEPSRNNLMEILAQIEQEYVL